MATEIVMPALGVAQETGRVVQWMVAEGETVAAGDPMLEIETDKVTVSIDAPASGVLSGVRADEGDEVPVGRVIAFILAPGEEAPAAADEPATNGDRADRTPPGRGEATDEPSQRPAAQTSMGRAEASPLARRRAREAGIDLAQVQGTGPGGAVTAADLDAAMATGAPSEDAGPPTVSAVWRRMAERVTASWTTAPHFYLSREVAAERLVAWRGQPGEDVPPTDPLLWLAARALERHPEANAVWEGDGPKRVKEINIGIAVAVADGLIVPVLHRANELEVMAVAERRRDVVDRTRRGELRPDDVAGGTFTVSNLGMFGVDSFAAIVNGPQAAILAVGRVTDRVMAVDGRPVVAPAMTVTLSCDHRVLDGARAARFLDTLVTFVEEPLRLVT